MYCGKAMQFPFEAIPPFFSRCTCTVGASLAISICSASDMLDKISGTATGSMLFSLDQTFGTFLSLLQRGHIFLVQAGLKCRSQVAGQVTGQVTVQVTGHKSGHRSNYRSGHRSHKNNRTLDKTVLD